MMADEMFPPGDFVATINQRTGRSLTSLDPLAMLLWHQATGPVDTFPLIVTGIL